MAIMKKAMLFETRYIISLFSAVNYKYEVTSTKRTLLAFMLCHFLQSYRVQSTSGNCLTRYNCCSSSVDVLSSSHVDSNQQRRRTTGTLNASQQSAGQ